MGYWDINDASVSVGLRWVGARARDRKISANGKWRKERLGEDRKMKKMRQER